MLVSVTGTDGVFDPIVQKIVFDTSNNGDPSNEKWN